MSLTLDQLLKFFLKILSLIQVLLMQCQIHRSGRKSKGEFREIAEVGLDLPAIGGNTCGFGRELPES